MSGQEARKPEQVAEWRERIGERVMHHLACNHKGDSFGDGAVCVTCFRNTQVIGRLMEYEVGLAIIKAGQAYGSNFGVSRFMHEYAERLFRPVSEREGDE